MVCQPEIKSGALVRAASTNWRPF